MSDLAGFAVNVGVTALASRLGAKSFVAGFAGGAAESLYDNDFKFDATDILQQGLLGGAGSWGGDKLSGLGNKLGPKAAGAGRLERLAADRQNDINRLSRNLPKNRQDVIDAERAAGNGSKGPLDTANDDLTRLNNEIRNLESKKRLSNKDAQALADKKVEAQKLNNQLDDALNKAQNPRALKVAKRQKDLLDQKLNAAKKKYGDDLFKDSKGLNKFGWGRTGLRALGSGTVSGIGSLYNALTGDDEGPGKPPHQGGKDGGGDPGGDTPYQPVKFVWDGSEFLGEEPFVRNSTMFPGIEGNGFLIRPKDLSVNLADWYAGPSDSFAKSLHDNYTLFGDLKNKKEVKYTETPQLTEALVKYGVKSKGMDDYSTVVKDFNDRARNFDQKDREMLAKVTKSDTSVEEVSKQGATDIGNLIAGMNKAVTSMRESDPGSFVAALIQGYGELIDTTELAAGQNVITAADLQKMADTYDQKLNAGLADVGKNLQSNIDSRLAGLEKPGGGNLADPNLGTGGDDSKIPSWADPGKEDSPTDADKSAVDRAAQDAIDRIEQSAGQGVPTGGGAGLGGMGAGVDPGLGAAGMLPEMLSGMALPAMMRNGMMGNGLMGDGLMGDPLAGAGTRALDDRVDRLQQATTPPPAQQASQTPWSNQNQNQNTATPAAHTPPDGANSTQQGTGTTPPVPGPDGKVPHTFRNGKVQRVWPAVHVALTAAESNTKDTDAKAAYAGTAAKWSDNKQIGASIDPSQLMTGDVATWDDGHSAIVVIWDPNADSAAPAAPATPSPDAAVPASGPGPSPDAGGGGADEGKAEIVINGELKPLPEVLAGSEFGAFSGFRHPNGIEGTGGATGDHTAPPPDAGVMPAVAVQTA